MFEGTLYCWPEPGWRVSRFSVAGPRRGGGFPDLASLHASFLGYRGGFPEFPSRRTGVLEFRRQVSRVSVAIRLHADSENPKTCRWNLVSVHDNSESRKTCHGGRPNLTEICEFAHFGESRPTPNTPRYPSSRNHPDEQALLPPAKRPRRSPYQRPSPHRLRACSRPRRNQSSG